MTLRDTFHIFLNVLSGATFGPKMTFLASQVQIVTHVHTYTHTHTVTITLPRCAYGERVKR